ncbi:MULTISPECIES: hypothetical protein [Paraburkholderia]|uniref:hypothetical protein n=1 Tax=Paraburkholderia TaxID=1822464 RepID=UPI0032185A69
MAKRSTTPPSIETGKGPLAASTSACDWNIEEVHAAAACSMEGFTELVFLFRAIANLTETGSTIDGLAQLGVRLAGDRENDADVWRENFFKQLERRASEVLNHGR